MLRLFSLICVLWQVEAHTTLTEDDTYFYVTGEAYNRTIGTDQKNMVQYYLKKSIPKDGVSMTMWEFHGNCFFYDVDISTWNVDDEAKCGLGFIYDSFKVDWLVLKMQYKGLSGTHVYSCEDGYSTSRATNSYSLDTTQNCHANSEKS
mmetsp:Transcript_17617/g.29747  ORF Transcript_17617/g.29747 Transcript_17617/m.29747 type:complete len:148 (-) Transcript_17617:379-822(-)